MSKRQQVKMGRVTGVGIAGYGSKVPKRTISNRELEKRIDTSDEWIVQRTGISRRHIIDPDDETQLSLATEALRQALGRANMTGADLDFVINATVSAETTVPANACRLAANVGATPAGAFDLVAGCSGFVYGMNIADTMIRGGGYTTIAVVGCDVLSRYIDYRDRGVAVVFGDGAAAMIFQAVEDAGRGCVYQSMGADGSNWHALYIPNREQDIPELDQQNPNALGCIRMRGREIYKFAVNKFCEVIYEALEETRLNVDDVSQFICHQSNARIIEGAMEKMKLPASKMHINISEYGNISAGSVPLVFEELYEAHRIKESDVVLFVAFGSGLTWASSVWRV